MEIVGCFSATKSTTRAERVMEESGREGFCVEIRSRRHGCAMFCATTTATHCSPFRMQKIRHGARSTVDTIG